MILSRFFDGLLAYGQHYSYPARYTNDGDDLPSYLITSLVKFFHRVVIFGQSENYKVSDWLVGGLVKGMGAMPKAIYDMEN